MDIIEKIVDLVRYLVYWLSTLIYQLIIHLYDIFMRLCNSRILDAEILKVITDRVGVILGLVMLFMVVFSMIQIVLEPEKLTDKEKGIANVVKKILLVVVMLGTSKMLFSGMYGLQKNIIESNIITKFMLPYDINEENQKNFGGLLAGNLFTSFYYYDEAIGNSNLTDESYDCKESSIILSNEILNDNKFSSGYKCLNVKAEIKDEEEYIMHLDLLLLPIVGVAAVYFIFSYCLSIGTRTIQLAFLEIISPMAIISYLSPKKDTMFQKWWKLYFATYIDVFLRIAIISLVIFLVGVIYDSNLSIVFWNSVGGKQGADILITVFIIFALLMFAKKAPDLLKDLFPTSASKLGLGVTSPKKLFDNMLGGNFVKGAAKVATAGTFTGAAGALISGFSRYRVNKNLGKSTTSALGAALFGATTGFGRGVVAGGKKGGFYSNLTKAISKQNEIDNNYETLVEGGGTLMGKARSKVSAAFGKTPAQIVDRTIGNLNKLNDYYGEIEKYANDMSCVKAAISKAEFATRMGAIYEDDEQYNNRINRAKNLGDAFTTAMSSGKRSFEFEGKIFDLSTSKGKEEYQNALSEARKEAMDTSRRMIKAAETEEEFNARKTADQDRAKDMSFCIQEAVLTKNYKVGTDEAGNRCYKIEFVDAKGVKEILEIKDKDIAKVGMMQNVQTEASYYSTSHNVEKYDSSTDTMVKVGEITSASQFKKLKQETNETIAHVKDEDYFKHKAEDAAAKVKDNGSGK